jgi:S1-C subfamily serine protease
MILLWLVIGLIPIASQAAEPNALSSVARVDIGLDAFSGGADLLQQLAYTYPLSPYQQELQRRLRSGSSGSAFCIAPHMYMTTAHVVLGGARYSGLAITNPGWGSLEAVFLAATQPWLTISTANARNLRLPAEVIALDIEKDLALLRCPDSQDTAPALALADPAIIKKGLPVSVLGYNREGLWVARGEILSLVYGSKVVEPVTVQPATGNNIPLVVGKDQGELTRIQHSAPVQAGVSGGPILSADNKVLGVAYGLLKHAGEPESASPALNLAVSVAMVQKFLGEKHFNELCKEDVLYHNGAKPGDPNLGEDATLTLPTASTPLLRAESPQSLSEVESLLRRGNTARAISLLTARLARNRYDFTARRLLALAHYQDSRLVGKGDKSLALSFEQAAWLAYFAPESEFGEEVKHYIWNTENISRVAKTNPAGGLRVILLSEQIQAKLRDAILAGNLPQDLERVRTEMEGQLAECAQARSRVPRSDWAADAALAHAYLAMESVWDLRGAPARTIKPEIRQKRLQLLGKAQPLGEALAAQMPASPGAQALTGRILARQGRLAYRLDLLEKARLAYERASRLDPASRNITTAALALAASTPNR